MNVETLLEFLEWLDGRGIVVTEPESYLRLEIEDWLESTANND